MNKSEIAVKFPKSNQNMFSQLTKIIKMNFISWLLMVPSLILFVIFHWQPIISCILLSFYKTRGYKAVEFVGFQNYIDVISDPSFMSALKNTFSYTLWSLIIGFSVPIIVAILINEMVHFKSFFKFSVYLPNMIPGIAVAILWYFMFDPGQGGLLNMLFSYLGLPLSQWLQNPHLTIPLIIITMTWRGFGSTTIIYLASLQGINQELYEASTLDGAGISARLRYITLPQISNIIKLMFILQIIGVFQVLYEPLTMTEGGPANASLSLMLQSYFYGFRYFQADKSMTVSVIVFFILIIFTAIYFTVKKDDEVE